MKTGALFEDLLTQSGLRQTPITQSQKDSWLRLMERERSSQFAPVLADKASTGTSGALSQATRPVGFAGFRTTVPDQSPAGSRELSQASGSARWSGGWANAAEAYGRQAAASRSDFSSQPALAQIDPMPMDDSAAATFSAEGTAALPSLERLLRQRWPRSNVLVARDGDGVQVWLRDPDLLEDKQALDAVVAQIKKALVEEGMHLTSLTVNGETIYCNQEG
jgi:hypothetical protein